jgi:nitrogen fixation NifU-like protein
MTEAMDLRELYQDVILDHGKHPRNRVTIPDSNRQAQGRNPLCGDEFNVQLKLDDAGGIDNIAFTGTGCAISVASASIMTELLKGKNAAEADALFQAFHTLCTTGEAPGNSVSADDLAYLEVIAGVRQFPVRVKCATLSWHTMKAALDGAPQASSEGID